MPIEGFWRSRGYGWILQIHSEGYSLFDVTPHNCIEFERGSSDDFHAGIELTGSDNEDHIALRVRHDITHYEFDRVTGLASHALFLDAPRIHAPIENFDYFCDVFEQDYAFFNLRGVDWEQSRLLAAKHIDRNTDEKELFSHLHSLIAPLRDNHVMLDNGTEMVVSEGFGEIKSLIMEELDLPNASIGDPGCIAKIGPFINQQFLDGEGKFAGNGSVIWGMLNADVGYLNILKLYGLSDSSESRSAADLPPRRPEHARLLRHDLDTIEKIMDRVMADLGNASAIILDVRVNGGGFDALGMAIAGRFADRKRLAFTKHARDGSGVTSKQHFFIEPGGSFQYTRPVYLLTSPRTASAGDIFALSMKILPQITLVGQPTTGILSDNLKKHLPNGWVTSISNEYYCSASGELFEGPGVPVDFETPVFVAGDFRAGYQLAVQKALELASTPTSGGAVHIQDEHPA